MKQKFFRQIADLRFSLLILSLISFFSILGTIIEQDQSIETYKLNYPLTNPSFYIVTWELILKLGLNHVYSTWWFFLLIFFFGLSLIFCTFLQQLPSLKIAKRCQFFRKPKQFYKLKIFTILKKFSHNKILNSLQKNKYLIFQQKSIVYCYKGLIGRIAPILVHFSMILVLLGTIIGSLFGFKAQELVPKTEHFHIQNIVMNGQWSLISKTSTRINDFWITYTKNKTVSQFYSDISILNEKGEEQTRKTILVNYPLISNNIYYYQTDWDLIGLRFQKFNNETIEYPLSKLLNDDNKIWLSWVSFNKSLNQGLIVLIDNIEGYCSLYNEKGIFLGNIELNEKIYFDQPFIFLEILSLTGLQIKTDPGIPIIYTGFFFLMLSTLISYLTYSQIWIFQKSQKLFIGGTTNRALFDFELEFFNILK